MLAAAMVFVALHPEAEGRMTLRSGAAELMRLATASGGAMQLLALMGLVARAAAQTFRGSVRKLC